jgi:hypothetical protein
MSSNPKRDQVEAKINDRAASDKNFKKQLMSDPHKALKEMGIRIPSEVNIHVRNEEPGTWELVIRKPSHNMASMSDDELRQASGGSCGWSQGDSHCF